MCNLCLLSPNKLFRHNPAGSLPRRAFMGAAGAALAMPALAAPAFAAPNSAAAAPGSAPGAADAKADVIIVNAKIITLNRHQPVAEAIAISNDRILGVGTRRAMEALRGPQTRIIDAQNRTIIPGLNDSHSHFIRGGLTYAQELRWDGVPSLAIALRMLKAQAQRTPAPQWVQVTGGFTAVQFAEKRLPTLQEINDACGDTPAFVLHLYDRALLNRAAIRAVGWTKDTPDPKFGVLERDGNGNPTGMIISTTSLASLTILYAQVPKLSPEGQVTSTRHYMRELNRLGITSVVDAGGAGQNFPNDYNSVGALAKDKQLSLRIGYSLFAQQPGKEADNYRDWITQTKPGDGDDYLRLLGAGEGLVWSAIDPANFAKDRADFPPVMEGQLVEVMKLLAANNWPFRFHATYEESATRILGVLEQVHREVPLNKTRWMMDHAETVTPRTLERVAAMGGGVAIQNRMTMDGDAFARKWGTKLAADAPPIGRMRSLGLPMACGTDADRANSYNPWLSLHWLVTGRTIGGTKLNADRNLVDRTEALRLWTAAGAYLTSEEDRKGTLEPGKWADLAILSDDYMTVPVNHIPSITAQLTMVGGKVVHGSGPFHALAPADLPVSPDWLPIKTWPGFYQPDGQRAELAAPALASATLPDILAEDGTTWSLGCNCGAI